MAKIIGLHFAKCILALVEENYAHLDEVEKILVDSSFEHSMVTDKWEKGLQYHRQNTWKKCPDFCEWLAGHLLYSGKLDFVSTTKLPDVKSGIWLIDNEQCQELPNNVPLMADHHDMEVLTKFTLELLAREDEVDEMLREAGEEPFLDELEDEF